MKYEISWFDSFNTFNWADEDLVNEEGTDFDDIVNNGIKNLKKEFPNIVIENQDNDGWIDCVITENFIADTEEELRDKVDEILEMTGREVDVFSVTDNTGKVVFTEEDLEQAKKYFFKLFIL